MPAKLTAESREIAVPFRRVEVEMMFKWATGDVLRDKRYVQKTNFP